jgi:hypothetical protein
MSKASSASSLASAIEEGSDAVSPTKEAKKKPAAAAVPKKAPRGKAATTKAAAKKIVPPETISMDAKNETVAKVSTDQDPMMKKSNMGDSEFEQYYGMIEPDPLAEDQPHQPASIPSNSSDHQQQTDQSNNHQLENPLQQQQPLAAQFSAATASQAMNQLLFSSMQHKANWLFQQQPQQQPQLSMLSPILSNRVLSSLEAFNPLPLQSPSHQQVPLDSCSSTGVRNAAPALNNHPAPVDAGEYEKVYDILSSDDDGGMI